MENFIERNKEMLVEMVSGILKIRSVEEAGGSDAPFGIGVKNSLIYALNKARELGFKPINIDNVLGYAEFGEGEDVISVLGHLDVVPEGKGWDYPPYGGEVHNGKLYGRGSIDDKGPIMAALFGLYAIKESGLKLSKRVRIIFGTNEETEWKCMNHLKDKVKEPLIGFTPDAEFPVINREKGILNVTLRKDFSVKNTEVSVKGGERPNMVPDSAEAVFRDDFENPFFNNPDININGKIISAKGISAHGALPEKGKNAITILMTALSKININVEVKSIVSFVTEKIGSETNGKSLGIAMRDELSGELTVNLGVLTINENFGEMIFNIRYPVTASHKEIVEQITKTAKEYGLYVSSFHDQPSLLVKEDEPLVKTLLEVYENFTGEKGYTISIGGGTYARGMNIGVAFGPRMPGMEEVEHMANEYIGVNHLVMLAKIYGRAIYELAK